MAQDPGAFARCLPRALISHPAAPCGVSTQVYSSQMQLGGPRVMGENGVSHYVVNDDLEGAKVILRWLSYCPAQVGAEPPLLPTNDPVNRPVAYEPSAHEKFDPRAAIMGEWPPNTKPAVCCNPGL